MKVHFYVLTPFPYGMAAGRRRICFCKGLMAAGDTCDVAICHKLYYSAKDDDGLPKEGIFKGIHYNYVAGKYKSIGKIKKGIDYYFLDLLKGFVHALKNINKGDIVYCYFYSIVFFILMMIATKIKGAKIVREVCEYPYVFGGDQGLSNRFYRWVELHVLFPHFNAFIPISISLENLVYKYKSKNAQTLRVPILVEDEFPELDYSVYKSEYEKPYILHTGTMDEKKDGISGILEAFAASLNYIPENVNLVFTGPQAIEPNAFNHLIQKLNISNRVTLKGLVSLQEIAILQHFATLSIINKNDNLQTRNCFPTKLGEMLLSETPVIITTIGDASLYLKDGISAYIINPNDTQGLTLKIIQALENKHERELIAKEGKKIAESEFNPILQGIKISTFFNSL
jgi:glycosyltransferase involved in cell wall biosynthesis